MKSRFGLALAATALLGGVTFLAVGADAQQGPGGPGPRGQRPQMSQEDRAAFFDARLAAIRAGLRLSADQDKLWPPVEAAARDMQKAMIDLRQKAQTAGRPANPIDGLKRRGEADSARGAALTRMADAAQPLWATLTDEQKRRFPMLSRGMMGGGRDGMERGRGRGHDDDRRMRRGDNQGPPPGGPPNGRGPGQGPGRDGQGPGGQGPGQGPGPGGPQRQGAIGGDHPFRLGQMGPVDRVYP